MYRKSEKHYIKPTPFLPKLKVKKERYLFTDENISSAMKTNFLLTTAYSYNLYVNNIYLLYKNFEHKFCPISFIFNVKFNYF
jgi:hypothetical protein